MLFKRKSLSPEHLYLAIYTLQKKGNSRQIDRLVSRFDIEAYLSCSPLMLTVAIKDLISKGWINDYKGGSTFFSIVLLSDAPSLVDVTQARSKPLYVMHEF